MKNLGAPGKTGRVGWSESSFQLSVESNQAITLVLALVLLQFEIG